MIFHCTHQYFETVVELGLILPVWRATIPLLNGQVRGGPDWQEPCNWKLWPAACLTIEEHPHRHVGVVRGCLLTQEALATEPIS